ncbi:unnamed protein product [Clavelina lepadiformis]|uniref:Uncharacterized protein n=1 Tax=Clavelina lepadiformis TaxID=159417 RepID=A0ABP0G481_CLALP
MIQKEKDIKVDKQEEPTTSGEFIFSNNDRYKGEYYLNENGVIQRHGFGTHTTSSGIVYSGCWKKDKMNGKGQLRYPSGATYEGEFNDNHYEGQGVYTWPEGCAYKGSFSGSKLQGNGTFSDIHRQNWIGQFHFKAAPGLRFILNL